MNLPKLSIITVCFNEAKRIKETCESIVNQTFQDFEWIVLDGGSTDGTVEILSQYLYRMSYFKSAPDKGIYFAMNEGIEKATGEYCLFLNGGDSLHTPFSLSQTMLFIGDNEDIIIGGVILKTESSWSAYLRRTWSRFDFLFYGAPHQGTLISTRLFQELDTFDTTYTIAADQEFYLRALNNQNHIKVIPVLLANYYLGGVGSNISKEGLREIYRLRKQYYGVFIAVVFRFFIRPLFHFRSILVNILKNKILFK